MRRRRPITPREYFLIVFLSLLLVALIAAVFGIFLKEEEARATADRTKQELATLNDRTEKLSKDIQDVTSERGKEAALRQMYGVAKPGEEVIIVTPGGDESKSFLSWWRRLLSWFGL